MDIHLEMDKDFLLLKKCIYTQKYSSVTRLLDIMMINCVSLTGLRDTQIADKTLLLDASPEGVARRD